MTTEEVAWRISSESFPLKLLTHSFNVGFNNGTYFFAVLLRVLTPSSIFFLDSAVNHFKQKRTRGHTHTPKRTDYRLFTSKKKCVSSDISRKQGHWHIKNMCSKQLHNFNENRAIRKTCTRMYVLLTLFYVSKKKFFSEFRLLFLTQKMESYKENVHYINFFEKLVHPNSPTFTRTFPL